MSENNQLVTFPTMNAELEAVQIPAGAAIRHIASSRAVALVVKDLRNEGKFAIVMPQGDPMSDNFWVAMESYRWDDQSTADALEEQGVIIRNVDSVEAGILNAEMRFQVFAGSAE